MKDKRPLVLIRNNESAPLRARVGGGRRSVNLDSNSGDIKADIGPAWLNKGAGHGHSSSITLPFSLTRKSSSGGRGRCGRVRVHRAFGQRVIVKGRVSKFSSGNGYASLVRHLKYLRRDGAGLDGKRPEFFSSSAHEAGDKSPDTLQHWRGDRHYFRFIVSPDRGGDLDLKEFSRELMARMETELGTKLEWHGVVHVNTDNPHCHFVVRGKDDNGEDLVLSREFMGHGLRLLAEEIATRSLGPRSQQSLREAFTANLTSLSYTALDRKLSAEADSNRERLVFVPTLSGSTNAYARRKREEKLVRLHFLKQHNLASEVVTGVWQVGDIASCLPALKRYAEVRALLRDRVFGGNDGEFEIFVPEANRGFSALGVVLDRGLTSELGDNAYLVIKTEKDKILYVQLSDRSEAPNLRAKIGSIVTLRVPHAAVRADYNISKYSVEGVFDIDAFSAIAEDIAPVGAELDEYVEAHRLRLGTLERFGLVKKIGDSSWEVPSDLTQLVEEYAEQVGRSSIISKISVESLASLDAQIDSPGPTWLDRQLERSQRTRWKASGIVEKDFQDALSARAQVDRDERRSQKDAYYRVLKARAFSALLDGVQSRYGRLTDPPGEAEAIVESTLIFEDSPFAVVKTGEGTHLLPISRWSPEVIKGDRVALRQVKSTRASGKLFKVALKRAVRGERRG